MKTCNMMVCCGVLSLQDLQQQVVEAASEHSAAALWESFLSWLQRQTHI
jgi:hypothetical protein